MRAETASAAAAAAGVAPVAPPADAPTSIVGTTLAVGALHVFCAQGYPPKHTIITQEIVTTGYRAARYCVSYQASLLES